MKIIFFILMILSTTSAFAGLLIEPQVGYILKGKTNSTFSSSGVVANLIEKYSSLEYGGRVGYSSLGLMGGLSYSHTISL